MIDTREILTEKLHSANIVLWGTGKLGQEFKQTFENQINIAGCTSNVKGEFIEQLSRIEPEQIVAGEKDFFIVICTSAHKEVETQLIAEGLLIGTDFIWQDLASAILKSEKIFLAVGQCEFAIIDYIYRSMPSFKSEFSFFYYDEYEVVGIEDKQPKLETILEVNYMIQLADYVVYPVNLTEKRELYYKRLAERVPDRCKIASVPLTTFEGYWPQDSIGNYYESSPYYVYNTQRINPFRNRRDINIEQAAERGKLEEIQRKIAEENFYDAEYVQKQFRKNIKKYQILERKSDITISDFLILNYKSRMVFRDRGHAASFVLQEYAERILQKFDIKYQRDELINVNLSWYEDNHSEFPIYPSVINALDLELGKSTYLLNSNGKSRLLTFNEYIEVICHYVELGCKYLHLNP